MSMGDVFAFFGALLALGIALPGMLVALSLLLPGPVERSRQQLEGSPWRCLGLGLVTLVVAIMVLGGLGAGPGQLLAWLGSSLVLGLAGVGAAGLAALMGDRLVRGGMRVSASGAMLRGAVALELAAIFPLLGWFVVIPLAAICSLGAAAVAISPRLRRRVAQPQFVAAAPMSANTFAPPAPAPDFGSFSPAEQAVQRDAAPSGAERHAVHTS